MSSRVRLLILALVVALLGAGGVALALRAGDDSASPEVGSTSTSTSVPSTTTTSEAPTTTTTEPAVAWPPLPDDGVARAVVTPSGVVLAVQQALDGNRYLATSPCGNDVTVAGQPVTGAHVVLDPGHGGAEPGAVGPAGTTEKAVNLVVALEAKRQLEEAGATVVLTRAADYRITLRSRAAIATALEADLFLSIHHNAEPDGPWAGPGAETYFQIASAESKRASGLVYEELVRAFSAYDIDWVADTDAGAKYRLASDGGDYYGILRRTAPVPAVLAEAAFISNPAEEALLNDPSFQAAEAAALTRAAIRFVTTDDPGSGFTEPYPRTQPAGSGGGPEGCVDPPFEG